MAGEITEEKSVQKIFRMKPEEMTKSEAIGYDTLEKPPK